MTSSKCAVFYPDLRATDVGIQLVPEARHCHANLIGHDGMFLAANSS